MSVKSSQFRELRDAIWDRARQGHLSSPQLLVALRLVEHWPDIYPGEKTLAGWTQLGESTVRRALADLSEAKVIRIVRNPGRGNIYAFLDANGNPIRRDVPSVGPWPVPDDHAQSERSPRSERAVTPSGASGVTISTVTAEADPDPKQTNKQTMEAGTLPLIIRTVPEGYTPSEDLLASAETAGCPRPVFMAKLAELRVGPIGGNRGVLADKLEEYLLRCSANWRTWAETDRARATTQQPRGGVFGRGVPSLDPSGPQRAYAAKHGLDLGAILDDLGRSGVVEALGARGASEELTKRLQSAARKKGTPQCSKA